MNFFSFHFKKRQKLLALPVTRRSTSQSTQLETSAEFSIVDSVGAEAINQTVKAISTVIANAPKRLVERVRRVSPDLGFDFDKKFEFSRSLAEFVEKYFKKDSVISAEFVLHFLVQARNAIDDHAHLLELDDYRLHKGKLAKLRIQDRETLEGFYSKYFAYMRTLNRLLFRELVEANAENSDANELVRIFDETLDAIRNVAELCHDLDKSAK